MRFCPKTITQAITSGGEEGERKGGGKITEEDVRGFSHN